METAITEEKKTKEEQRKKLLEEKKEVTDRNISLQQQILQLQTQV
eukprot:CAMPEP_0170554912 /NCGR_PEP_ID=MMETSP0211-20121228/12797_1 /TAXON_ID=311385 /ORGANISM="Pseudokeronopsis sp., Strain OXSARD2" /LENGTH=44 /DNA_ID= /DNA_START= /DNA_END= /DNA_ORIENTATION=